MNLSVLILTLNEEVNIAGCLASVAWCDDVVVLDSFSTDETVNVAEQGGTRVVQRTFDTYAAQRNYGLTEISFRHEWILMLDADERVPADLRDEMLSVTQAAPGDVTLYLMRRRDHLLGRWLKRSSGYPTWFGRLARAGHVWIERPINEEYHTAGTTLRLDGHIDHYPFNKGFSAWIERHNQYSTMEAELMSTRRLSSRDMRLLFSADPLVRRKALKAVVYALPARPLLVFVSLYVLRGGFMDGGAGFTFSCLRAWYEFSIDCKYRELARRRLDLPI